MELLIATIIVDMLYYLPITLIILGIIYYLIIYVLVPKIYNQIKGVIKNEYVKYPSK
jgi:hypothetical protein